MPASNPINPAAAEADLQRLLERSHADERVARWAKKKARGWMLGQGNSLERIYAGHPFEAELPEWAQRVRERGDDVHYYRLDAGSADILRHIEDFLSDLLDYEKSDDAEMKQMASRFLENLSHHGVVDLYSQANDFYRSVANAGLRSASRSRHDVFAIQEPGGALVEHVCESGLIWKRVVPRGLKTVAVVLENCLGGRGYAEKVKAGASEVWCLVKTDPSGEFNHQRDILAAAEVRVVDAELREVKAKGNILAKEFIPEIEDFAIVRKIDANSELRMLQEGGLSKRMLDRQWTIITDAGDELLLEAKNTTSYAGKEHTAECRALALGSPAKDGGVDIQDLLTLCRLSNGDTIAQFGSSDLGRKFMNMRNPNTISRAMGERIAEEHIVATVDFTDWSGLTENGPQHRLKEYLDGAAPSYDKRGAILIFDENHQYRPWFTETIAERGNDQVSVALSARGAVTITDLTRPGTQYVGGFTPGLKEAMSSMEAIETKADWRKLFIRGAKTVGDPTISKHLDNTIRQSHSKFGSVTPAAVAALHEIDPVGFLTQVRTGGNGPDLVNLDIRGKLIGGDRSGVASIIAQRGTLIDEREAWSLHRLHDGGGISYAVSGPDGRLEVISWIRDGSIESPTRMRGSFDFSPLPVGILISLYRDLEKLAWKAFEEKDPFSRSGKYSFPQQFLRSCPTKALRNLGTDETPFIALTKPPRRVGIVPGADGSLEGGSIAWIINVRGDDAFVHHLSPHGIEHLMRTSEAQNWRLVPHEGFKKLNDFAVEHGFHFGQGRLRQMSNAGATDLTRGAFFVDRDSYGIADDRWFRIKRQGPNGRTDDIFSIEPNNPGENDAAHARSRWYHASPDEYREGLALLCDLANMVKLEPCLRDCQLLGIEKDENGQYRPGNTDLAQNFDIGHGFVARRAPGVDREGKYRHDFPGANNVNRDLWGIYHADKPEKLAACLGTEIVSCKTPSADLFRAMATLSERLEAGTVLDHPVEIAAERAMAAAM